MLRNRLMRKFNCLLKERTNIKTSLQNENTLLIELNRPKALNALCDSMIDELNSTLQLADADNNVRTVVLTGSQRAFAAGADIKEMVDKTYSDSYSNQMLGHWDQITQFRYFLSFFCFNFIFVIFILSQIQTFVVCLKLEKVYFLL